MKQHFDCIIVGAGISGLTAAIYLKRANLNILIIEKYVVGGQINKTSNIENYPGFEKIDGPSLVMNVYEQINKLNIEIKYEEVLEIEKENIFKIKTESNEYTSSGIIIATGRTPNSLNLDNEKELLGKGISYCALCDGNFFKDKDVCVIGSGNSAFEESLYLSEICKSVKIIIRNSIPRASEILINQVNTKKNIDVMYNSVIEEIIEENNKLNSIKVNGNNIKCDGLFIYIGSSPSLDFLKNMNINKEKNYLIVDKDMRTNIDKLYACGDTIDKNVYQIITAASEGAIAAVSFVKDFKN